VLAFVRRDAGAGTPQALLCAFNLSGVEVRYALPADRVPAALDASHPLRSGALIGQTLVLPPGAAVFATL
jgi:hypothetical protein